MTGDARSAGHGPAGRTSGLPVAIRLALDRLLLQDRGALRAAGETRDDVAASLASVQRLLGAALVQHLSSAEPGEGARDGGPAAAVRAACAFLGAGDLEDAYLALRAAHDHLPPVARSLRPTAGAASAPSCGRDGLAPGRAAGERAAATEVELIVTAVEAVERRCRRARYRGLTPQSADGLCETLREIAAEVPRAGPGEFAEASALARRILDDDHPDHTDLWARLTERGVGTTRRGSEMPDGGGAPGTFAIPEPRHPPALDERRRSSRRAGLLDDPDVDVGRDGCPSGE